MGQHACPNSQDAMQLWMRVPPIWTRITCQEHLNLTDQDQNMGADVQQLRYASAACAPAPAKYAMSNHRAPYDTPV